MIKLATIVMAAYAFTANATGVWHHKPLMPVVIQSGPSYEYAVDDTTIYVPNNWNDSCYNQEQLVYQMFRHFNSFRARSNKIPVPYMDAMARKWVCLTEDGK